MKLPLAPMVGMSYGSLMTNHTHTIHLTVRLADVRSNLVLNVATAAVEALTGTTTSAIRLGAGDTAEAVIDHYALNDKEAERTALVARSAVLPLVKGATVWSTPVSPKGKALATGRTEVRAS